MKKDEAQIWHIYHSGFVVKTSSYYFVFDYYRNNPLKESPSSTDQLPFLNSSDTHDVIVFVSHGHDDHFNPIIFDWRKSEGEIMYALSYDVEWAKYKKEEDYSVTIVRPNNTYWIKEVVVEVFDSTDMGVSFFVSSNGMNIFHAGDLNWWHWEEDSEEEKKEMEMDYKGQIDRLRGTNIDLAFIPVDPRLGDSYRLALIYFMETVGAQWVFPMHFGEDDSIFKRLKMDLPAQRLEHIVELNVTNDPFLYRRS